MVVFHPQTWTDVMHAFYKKCKELTQGILYSTIPALAVPNRNHFLLWTTMANPWNTESYKSNSKLPSNCKICNPATKENEVHRGWVQEEALFSLKKKTTDFCWLPLSTWHKLWREEFEWWIVHNGLICEYVWVTILKLCDREDPVYSGWHQSLGRASWTV